MDIGQIADLVAARRLPPVEQWQPHHSSDSRMRIDANGRWFHDGGEIRRPAMIRAFSTLLRKEADGGYSLVTPYERQSIIVDDAPFCAVEMEVMASPTGPVLAFRLNTDDLVMAGPDHPLSFFDMESAPRAYLHVRGELMARLNRPTFYALVDLAMEAGEPLAVISNGMRFNLTREAST